MAEHHKDIHTMVAVMVTARFVFLSIIATSMAFVYPPRTTTAFRSMVRRPTPFSPSSSSSALPAWWNKAAATPPPPPVEVVEKEMTAFEQVASKGLAGVLAITLAEAIFWALGMPLSSLWVKVTTGEWLDITTTEGQLQAAGFTFGYGGFATVILQYRVTLFAIPFVDPIERMVVQPGKKFFGEKFGAPAGGSSD